MQRVPDFNKTMDSIGSAIVQNIKNAHSSPIDGISMAAKKIIHHLPNKIYRTKILM